MTNKEFIEKIAVYVRKYAPQYGVKVCSPIIAQAVLESGYGTTELAVNANNFFGLKYREGRCKTCIGIYTKVGSEQNADGTYTSSTMKWCKFADMENGVIGYFDFTNISNYSNLKGVTDPQTYLERIKADGYATSLDYVKNLMRVINTWNLTQYDNIEGGTEMSNSSLVVYTKLSPNHSGARTHAIDRITPHCVVGQLTAEGICGCFTSESVQASCNYAIGTKGRVGLCVEEKNRSWCSSSNANDQRAVTIECASDCTDPYTMNDAVYAALVDLCADICKRNGKTKLLWLSTKEKSLAYEPKSTEMVLTVHRWFANKACPGDWLYSRMGDLASKVNAKLGSSSSDTSDNGSGSTTTSGELYRVRKTWKDSKTQIGAYTELENAKKAADANKGYSVYNSKGKKVYAGKTAATSYTVKVTVDALNIRKGAGTNYAIAGTITDKGIYTIVEESGGWGKLKSGEGWISLQYTEKC